MPQDLEERVGTVQDILKKFETQTLTENNCNRINGLSPHVSGRNDWSVAGSSSETKTVDVCSWTTRRRRDQQRPVTVRTAKPSGKLTPSSSPEYTQIPKQQIRVSEIAKLFQNDSDIASDTNSGKCGALKCRNESALSGGIVDRSPKEVKNEYDVVEQGPTIRAQPSNVGIPPQKPARTFAHDVYLKSKLIQDNLGSPKLLRAHSNMAPKISKPKLPPKPIRAKTVPPVKGSLKSPQLSRKSVKITRPRTPPPRPPPPASTITKNAYPQPYAVSTTATWDNLTPLTNCSRPAINGQKGRYGVLRRFRSEERVYDVPSKKRSERSFERDTLDKWKSSLVIDRLSDAVYVDNEVYEATWNPDVQSGKNPNSKSISSLGQKSRQELHYMVGTIKFSR